MPLFEEVCFLRQCQALSLHTLWGTFGGGKIMNCHVCLGLFAFTSFRVNMHSCALNYNLRLQLFLPDKCRDVFLRERSESEEV